VIRQFEDEDSVVVLGNRLRAIYLLGFDCFLGGLGLVGSP